MDSYNLRFGPATSNELEIYTGLVPILTEIRDSAKGVPVFSRHLPIERVRASRHAAKDAFKSMKWENLESHTREQ